jgi:ferredoxin
MLLGSSNTSLNIVNEERSLQAVFNASKDAMSIQTVSAAQQRFFSEPLPCFGPEIISYVDKNVVEINQTVIITGIISPPRENASVRICCIRPDYSWIEMYVPSDPQTGAFGPTEVVLDMKGYWNLCASNSHISDRMFVEVNDSTGTAAEPNQFINPWKVNVPLLATAVVLTCTGIVFAITGLKKKTRRISSLRICIMIFLVFLIFTGVFVDHQKVPRPVRQVAVHELLVGTNIFGVSMPEGFAMPFLACYYPCGRTVTCALWELQTYIYPFLESSHGWGVYYNTSGIARLAVIIGGLIACSLILGRAWCGWVCPFGLYHDLLSYLRKRLKIRHITLSDRVNKSLHQLSYVILAVILILCTLFASYTIAGTQLIPGTEEGGFIYRYFSEPFCTVCPMKPLCVIIENQIGIFQTEWVFNPTGDFYQLGRFITSINVISLILVSVAALFISRAWCRICPLGGLVGLFSKVPPFKWLTLVQIEKTKERCTKCGICRRVCPMEIKEVYEKDEGDIMTPRCIGCLHCIEMCPYKDALKFKFAGKTLYHSQDWLLDDLKKEEEQDSW